MNDYSNVKTPNPTKENIEQFLAMMLQTTGKRVTSFVRLTESFSGSSFTSGQVPHACLCSPALQVLAIQKANFYNKANVEYYCCALCGKVVYYIERWN